MTSSMAQRNKIYEALTDTILVSINSLLAFSWNVEYCQTFSITCLKILWILYYIMTCIFSWLCKCILMLVFPLFCTALLSYLVMGCLLQLDGPSVYMNLSTLHIGLNGVC